MKKKEIKREISTYLQKIRDEKANFLFKPVLSGDESRDLWKAINKISKLKKKKKIKRAAEKAVYMLGCKCQELESNLNALALVSYAEWHKDPKQVSDYLKGK